MQHTFIPEVQKMMFAMGDSRDALIESATLIEQIVHNQLSRIVNSAMDIAHIRGARIIGIEDIVFLMRNDRRRLIRLINAISYKDVNNKLLKTLQDEDEISDVDLKQPFNKRRKICFDLLSTIDTDGSLIAALNDDNNQPLDDIKLQRLQRADKHSRGMDAQLYQQYTECRQVNFYKKLTKFREWLDYSNLELKPNALALEVLGYLAYETMATLIDLVMTLKQEENALASDPLSRVRPALCVDPAVGSPLLSTSSIDQMNTSQPESPSQTPPVTPGDSGAQQTTSSTINKPNNRNRKRRKSGVASGVYVTHSIQPSDIREAMRRFNKAVSPLSIFNGQVGRSSRPLLAI